MANQQERAELHKTIWKIANDLRGSVDGWEFKAYVLGSIFYRFISENICDYIHGLTVDVWLIYRCKKCKHSWNLTIYERTRPGKIPSELFEAFQANSADAAAAYGRNFAFLKKNHAEFK